MTTSDFQLSLPPDLTVMTPDISPQLSQRWASSAVSST